MNDAVTDKSTTTPTSATAVADPTPTPATESKPSSSTVDTLERAFARAATDPSSAAPAATVPAVSADKPAASTTVTPVAAVAASTTEKGPIPYDRHEAALANARSEGETALKALRDKIGWAETMDHGEAEKALRLYQMLNTDDGARAIHAKLSQELQSLSTDSNDPEPDLISTDGTKKGYSAEATQRLITNAITRAVAAVRKEMQPSVDFTRTEREKADFRDQLDADKKTLSQAVAQIEKLPWYDKAQHGALIHQRFTAMTPDERKAAGGLYGALMRAAHDVSVEVWPTIQQRAQTAVEADFQRKAASSTGVTTTSTVPSGQKFKSTEELLQQKFAAARG